MSGGKFELIEILGSGAFASVVVARDVSRSDKPLVALKVLRANLQSNASASDRFRDEAGILRHIDHPSIVRVAELHDYDGRPVMVMEYVRGANAEQLFLGGKVQLPYTEALEVCRRVADALHDAYHGGYGPGGLPMRIIHRDVKPENIMVSVGGEVKLLDFGIATGTFDHRRAKSLYNVAGSAGYQAPERAMGEKDTQGADVYALGATALVLLTGRPMLVSMRRERHAASVDELMAKLAPPGLRDPAPLRDLLRRTLAFDVEDRPAMAEVAEELGRIVAETGASSELEDAAAAARALYRARQPRPIEGHLEFADLRFLQHTLPSRPPAVLDIDEAAQAIRSFVAQPDWEERVWELQRLLEAAPEFIEEPFFELLAKADVPKWQFWRSAARPSEVEAALLLLCDHPTQRVMSRARELAEHVDERISAAARFVVSQHG